MFCSPFGYQQTYTSRQAGNDWRKKNTGCQPVPHSLSTYLVTFHFPECDKLESMFLGKHSTRRRGR